MNDKRRAALRVLERIEQAGYEAYLVGGCVRDLLLDLEPKDYDICTNALPEEIQQIFERTLPTGIKHGTVTVFEQKIPFEVTTFREEAEYTDYRRPTSVTFVSQLETDLSRRDFTMNAMAQDRFGTIVDPFGGRKDIQDRRIRCVGDPRQRFSEDALRMVRAARFVAQFGFALDERVSEAMHSLKDRVQHLAIERIVAEVEKIWGSRTPARGLKVLWEHDLWAHLPVFKDGFWKRVSDQWIEAFDRVRDRIVSWSYLLYLGHIAEQEVRSVCRKLTLSKVDTSNIWNCYRLGLNWHGSINEKPLKLYLLQYGFQTTYRAYQLMELIHLRKPYSSMEQVMREVWESMPARSIAELSLDGKDLLQYTNRKAGPWMRETFNHLLVRVALGEIPNQKEILLEEGSQFAAKHSNTVDSTID